VSTPPKQKFFHAEIVRSSAPANFFSYLLLKVVKIGQAKKIFKKVFLAAKVKKRTLELT